jgi:predicted outer membrane repeat protein
VKIQFSYCKYEISIKVDAASGLIIENIDISGLQNSIHVFGAENTQMLSIHSVNFYECSVLFRRLHFANTDSLQDCDDSNCTVNVTIQDSIIEQSGQTGVRLIIINSNPVRPTIYLTIANTTIAHHQQGGIIIESSSTMMVTITDSTIEENQLPFWKNGLSAGAAVGFGIYTTRHDTTVTIRNTHFIKNQDFRGQPTVVFVSGAKGMEVFESEFRDNRGAAIRMVNNDNVIIDYLRLYGDVVFHNNTGQRGGALSLATLQTQVQFMPGLHVTFENNRAEDVGGAIYVEIKWAPSDTNTPGTSAPCFYQFPSLRNQTVDYSISFTNNSAKNGGNHVYGASLMCYCLVYSSGTDQVCSSDPEIRSYFHFDSDTISPVSSSPYRACIIDPDSPTRLTHHYSECLNIFKHEIIAFPGLEFSLGVILVGDEFGISAGTLYAQVLPNKTEAQIQPLLQTHPPQVMNYRLYSKNSHEVLVLTATNEKIVHYGNPEQMDEDIEIYNSTGIIPPDLLTTPIYVNVRLLKCPTGYYFNHVSLGCVCNPRLCDGQITKKFSNGRAILYNITENIWINAYNSESNNISGIIMHHNCPFDYCKVTAEGLELTTPNSQCAMSHAGTLCGKCAPGLSLALGSNKCLPCSNDNYLALLIFFVAAGFLLVFFIQILNMTVSQGTINGLIFYANIMWAYQSVFLSYDEKTDIGRLWFLKTFIAWINLDFGIETCFIQGLTAYTKTWLQFVFPFYVWSIAGGMILLASYSKKMTRLLGNNTVQVMATLFLLSYAKLLRTTIIVLMPATLYVFADNGEPVANQSQLVWAFDGNLLYGRVPHVFLLIFALLVLTFLWLPFTFILLFIQSLRSNSERRCLGWINRQKPLLEAYTGPLNDNIQFWVGLLLLARFVLLLTFIVTYSINPSASVLALVMTIILLLTVLSYVGQVYNNPIEFDARFLPEKVSVRSILEISCLFNLVVVGGSFLYLNSVSHDSNTSAKTGLVYASVAFVFLQFTGIVTYNLYSRCSTKLSCTERRLQRKTFRNRNRNSSSSAVTVPIFTTTISINTDEPWPASNTAGHHHSTSGYGSMLEQREPLLNTGPNVAMTEATYVGDTY